MIVSKGVESKARRIANRLDPIHTIDQALIRFRSFDLYLFLGRLVFHYKQRQSFTLRKIGSYYVEGWCSLKGSHVAVRVVYLIS